MNMFQVYRLSIGAACSLSWPKNRLIVQVLDDSDEAIKVLDLQLQSADTRAHDPTPVVL